MTNQLQTLTKEEVLAIADPCQHTMLAHRPTDQEIQTVFKENPSSVVIVCPDKVFTRRLHYKP